MRKVSYEMPSARSSNTKTASQPVDEYDYSPLDKDFQAKLSRACIGSEHALNLLDLLLFLNRTFFTHFKYLKFFYYGPAINGLSAHNQIQFSIDVVAQSPNYNYTPCEIMALIHNKLLKSDLYKFDLECEERFDRGKSFLQLMNNVLTLQPTSKKWKAGTRIFITVGNRNKVLES